MTTEPTKVRLAKVLKAEGLDAMAKKATAGQYDDYLSNSATPIQDLVADLRAAGRDELVRRAINGEWDGSLEESGAWFEREGKDLLKGTTP